MKGWRLLLGLCLAAISTTAIVVSASGSPSPTASSKAAFMQQQAADRAAAAAGPRASKASGAGPAVGETPVRQSGILNVRQGPVSVDEFLVNNSWQGPVNGSGSAWWVVWAGSMGPNGAFPGAPGIIVHVQTPTADGTGFTDVSIGTFADQKADGPLSISAVNGTTIQLQSAAGHMYRFNLETNQFV